MSAENDAVSDRSSFTRGDRVRLASSGMPQPRSRGTVEWVGERYVGVRWDDMIGVHEFSPGGLESLRASDEERS